MSSEAKSSTWSPFAALTGTTSAKSASSETSWSRLARAARSTRSDFVTAATIEAFFETSFETRPRRKRSPGPVASSAGRHMTMASTSLRESRTMSLSLSPSSVRGRCRPGVSTRMSWPLSRLTTALTTRRVVSGRSEVIATFWPTSALVSVDFPVFGRPTTHTNPALKPSGQSLI